MVQEDLGRCPSRGRQVGGSPENTNGILPRIREKKLLGLGSSKEDSGDLISFSPTLFLHLPPISTDEVYEGRSTVRVHRISSSRVLILRSVDLDSPWYEVFHRGLDGRKVWY